jgi:eukaryotic-like serine/threonine-protein kinase
MALSRGQRLGPYQIVAPIGAGGMGEVYRARDTRLGRGVAIKVLPAEFASDNHPNILALYEIGTHEGSPHIVTELLDGASLREK